MSNLIAPRNPVMSAGVTIPALDPQMDAQRRQQGGLMYGQSAQPVDPLYALRSMFNSAPGAATGGVEWERYDNNSRLDPTFQEIMQSGTQIDENSAQYQIQRVAPIMGGFAQQLLARTGMFYNWYSQTVDTFKLDPQGNPCPVATEFVEFYKRRPEIIPMVARNSAPVFGYEILTRMNKKGQDQLEQREYGQATEVSIRLVMFFEMINWLNKTEIGRRLAFNLPEAFKQRLAKLEEFKAFGVQVYQLFSLPFPYEGLTLDIRSPVAPGAALLQAAAPMYEPIASNALGYQTHQTEFTTVTGNHSIGRHGQRLMMDDKTRYQILCYKLDLPTHAAVADLERRMGWHPDPLNQQDLYDALNARNSTVSPDQQYQPAQPRQHQPQEDYATSAVFTDLRTDYQNITPYNRAEFDWRKHFIPAHKPNHYLVKEEVWGNLSRGFNTKDTLKYTSWGGLCYRIVHMDLSNPDTEGYSSYILRDVMKRFTPMQVFTDPEKCLPQLESDDNGNVVVSKPYNAKDIIPEKDMSSFIIPADKVRELDGQIPTIVVDEPLRGKIHHSLLATAAQLNDTLAGDFKTMNATANVVVALEELRCKSSKTKKALIEALPILFKENVADLKKMSYFEAMRLLKTTLDHEDNIEPEVRAFLRFKLTQDFNNFMVNNCGAYQDANDGRSLTSQDILKDLEELYSIFEQHDKGLLEYLDGKQFTPTVLCRISMFTYDQLEMETITETSRDEDTGAETTTTRDVPVKLSPLQQLDLDTLLPVESDVHLTTINRVPSPVHVPRQTVIIKRSAYPEIFSMVETGFMTAYPEETHFNEVNHVVRFSADGQTWLFNKSVYDVNTAILRHVVQGASDMFMFSLD